jgi:transcriptional regulator GlxA family with amidase domain
MASRGSREGIGSICTGAFPLAGAGLLDDRCVTTHWQWCDQFRSLFPNVRVDSERIFIRDHGISTSAGITAGMDLALSMVEEDHGHRVAIQIARELVMFLRRPGGQSQFSTALAGQVSDWEPLRELVPWMLAHLEEPLRVEDLATQAGMSVRHFTRVFAERTGYSPAVYLERLRVEAGCRRLEESSRGTKEIAAQCGFGDADRMRKAFRRVLNTTPEMYRHVFAAAEPGHAAADGVELRA